MQFCLLSQQKCLLKYISFLLKYYFLLFSTKNGFYCHIESFWTIQDEKNSKNCWTKFQNFWTQCAELKKNLSRADFFLFGSSHYAQQCFTSFESEMHFSLKAVSGLNWKNIARITTENNIVRRITESHLLHSTAFES